MEDEIEVRQPEEPEKSTKIAVEARRPAGAVALPDDGRWESRFEIRSESSDRIYVIAREKRSQKWACSCPGYLRHRKCKHLTTGCGLPLTAIYGRDRLESQ